MALLSGQELANFVAGKVGTPYVYGAKGADGAFTRSKYNYLAKAYPKVFTQSYKNKILSRGYIGKTCTDCSGLISWKTGKVLGSSQLYSQAYARLPMSKLNDFAIGTVLWKQGHVGVYCGKDANGKPICIEAKGIDYGTVRGVITNPSRWTCGLTFSWMSYEIANKITDITYKGKNPYATPTTTQKKGSKGTSVKWVQWELQEAGFAGKFTYAGKTYSGVKIDGDFGSITDAAVSAFQASCKIGVDGKVGPATRSKLIADC